MVSIPKKIKERLSSSVKKFQPVLKSAKSRDVNESDTVIIITDMLSDLFGYDKYSEITSELAIRNTYCDLATKIDGKIKSLIEVKAIGLELKDNFVKQAIDYAANQGIDWVYLTNGVHWKVFKVSFGKPIDKELVFEFDFLQMNNRNQEDIEMLFYLSKEGWLKDSLEGYHAQRQVLSKFSLAALIMTDSSLNLIRKELKKISPDVKVDNIQIKNVIEQEVLKREVVEGEQVEAAKKAITRIHNRNKAKNNKPVQVIPPITITKDNLQN